MIILPVVYPAANVDDFVLDVRRGELDLVNNPRSEVVFVGHDSSPALTVSVVAQRQNLVIKKLF